MRRLAPVAGAVLALGSLLALAFLVAPDEGGAAGLPALDSQDRAMPRVRPVVEPSALALLARAAAAPAATSYTGTQYVSAWDEDSSTSRVLDVSHDPERGTTWRVAGADETSGSALHTTSSPTPSLLGAGAVGLIARYYSLATAGTGSVAGRTTDVVVASRPTRSGSGRVTARFWLDKATGLTLRREVYDNRGRTTRASAFVDVAVGPPLAAAVTQASTAWPEALDGAEVQKLRQHGWRCPLTLPGPLPLVDARKGGDGAATLHLSYADGIASVSVFQQRGRLDEEDLAGFAWEKIGGHDVWVRAEVPERIVWSSDGVVYTLVADAPASTVKAAVASLYVERGGGVENQVDRLGRGLDRVASWFNPGS